MANETNAIIQYQGNKIGLYSDERNDYINLTEMAVACGSRKHIRSWMNTKATINFLVAWENKNNPKFTGAEKLPSLLEKAKKSELYIQDWIEQTNAVGILSQVRGAKPGTWAHKDIALKFAGWLSPEFELFIVEEVQRLKKIEHQKNSYDLLSHDQILALVQLKEVFKYIAHQEAAEKAHKDVYASKSTAEKPFAEFNSWRNKILEIDKQTIEKGILNYCIDNKIASAKKMLKMSKREQILILDSPETVKIAVWDFLTMKGEINALNLANLVGNMMRLEHNPQLFRKNEDTLFEEKQDLGKYSDFIKMIDEAPEVKTAREILDWREKEIKRLQSQSLPFGEIIKRIAKAGKPNI